MVPTMPSKLRKAFGAVKDQTSISLAKVSNTNAANLEVLILKATTHDEIPIDERYVNDILRLISSDKVYAAACAQAISKRIGKTRNWVVALKSLMLVLRTFQDGDPYFPREVLHAMKRGAKILNLSNFRDDSNSSPWDYTAFVRTFALYLDERLDCFLKGKLQRRVSYRQREGNHHRRRPVASSVRDMKPAMLLDRISYWQRLIDRAIGTRPTGEAKTNRLILLSVHAVVQESFDLYRDISEGLALLLDSFFHLQYQSCVSAFQACVKATKQFELLSSFYDLCKSIGVGRTSEYPSVQKISEELIEILQDFLRDQASFPSHNGHISPSLLPAPPPQHPGSSSGNVPHDQSEASESFSPNRGSGSSSGRTSLEDLTAITEPDTNPSMFIENRSTCLEDFISAVDYGSNCSLPVEQGKISGQSIGLVDDLPQNEEKNEQENQLQKETTESLGLELDSQRNGWELVLSESATQQVQPSTIPSNGFEPSVGKDLFSEASLPQNQYNPFLQETIETTTTATTKNDPTVFRADKTFSVAPTFQAAAPTLCEKSETMGAPTLCAQNFDETKTVAPTFCAQPCNGTTAAPTFLANNPQETTSAIPNEVDPFAADPGTEADKDVSHGSITQKNLLHEQQLWLENQHKIIAKHMS